MEWLGQGGGEREPMVAGKGSPGDQISGLWWRIQWQGDHSSSTVDKRTLKVGARRSREEVRITWFRYIV